MRWCDSTPPAQKPFRKDWRPLDGAPLAISADCVRGREGRWEGGYIHTPRGSQPKLVTTGIYIYGWVDGWTDGLMDGKIVACRSVAWQSVSPEMRPQVFLTLTYH